MSSEKSLSSDPRLAFAAIMPLKVLPRFSPLDLLAAVTDLLDGTGASATLDPDLTKFDDEEPELNRIWRRPKVPPRIGMHVNGVTVMVEGHDRPAYTQAELARLDAGAWTNAQARIMRCRSYVEVAELHAARSNDLDFNHDRAAAVTVMAAAVNRLAEAAAIVWQTSRRAIPGEELVRLVDALIKGNSPVGLWVSCPTRPEGARGAATRGFYPLLGAEIVVSSMDLDSVKAGEIALDLAVAILRGGDAPAPGERLKYDKKTEFMVEHRAAEHYGGVPAIVLTQSSGTVETPDNPTLAAGAA